MPSTTTFAVSQTSSGITRVRLVSLPIVTALSGAALFMSVKVAVLPFVSASAAVNRLSTVLPASERAYFVVFPFISKVATRSPDASAGLTV